MTPRFNQRNRMDGRDLLARLHDSSVALLVLDPEYRAVLDKMAYGNEGARQKGRALLRQMTDVDIARFVAEAERVLKPSGHLALWVDKFALVSARWQRWLPDISPMRSVECFIWDKKRIGMGKRGRCRYEALIVIQKAPICAKGFWRNRNLPDVHEERSDRQRHAHSKPLGLMREIVLNTTQRGDLVVDPCAGGYGMLDVCVETKRTFLGCDLAS